MLAGHAAVIQVQFCAALDYDQQLVCLQGLLH
jgi:hypothetical protein